MSILKEKLPWTSTPLVLNAPMGGFAGGKLAAEVSLAGSIGFIGGAFDMDDVRVQLKTASDAFKSDSILSASKTLPVGVGFVTCLIKVEDVLPGIRDFKPAVVWLFAAKELDDNTTWAKAIREVSPDTMIWIQVGSVEAALYLAQHTKPDAICLQGIDAGGHGFEKGAGIISLVPEASDALAQAGFSHIPLLASGGIVDGRGVAAAVALGAAGVVMGTRFLASKEIRLHPQYQAAVLEAQDGGQSTTRSKVFDQLAGPNIWPSPYDGRSIVMQSYKDHLNGVSLEEIQKLHNNAKQEEDKGFGTGGQGRAAIWAGTGVGLVKEVIGAREIVESSRKQAREILQTVSQP